jgi:hypothetical protein
MIGSGVSLASARSRKLAHAVTGPEDVAEDVPISAALYNARAEGLL